MKHAAFLGLALAALVGCTATSGPNYSVTSVSQPGHDQAYRVSCDGVFGSYKTCQKVAARVCGSRQVNPLESTAPYAGNKQRDPSSLTFECTDAAPQSPDPVQ
jgi:hypothetical protein